MQKAQHCTVQELQIMCLNLRSGFQTAERPETKLKGHWASADAADRSYKHKVAFRSAVLAGKGPALFFSETLMESNSMHSSIFKYSLSESS